MLSRIAIFSGLMLALVAGAFAVDNDALRAQRLPGSLFAQAPAAAPLPGENSQAPSPPSEPAAPPSVIDPATAPKPAQPPALLGPSADAPAPVVVTPPAAETPAPVVVAPVPEPTPAPSPVVVTPAPLPPEKPAIAEDKKETPAAAKLLFAAKQLPTIGKAVAIGYYPRGCLQGGVALPVTGASWQVMRVSRNRNWGHPSLVHFLEKFAPLAAKATGWKGILVGDMAQPRGGPLPFGHMSHQIGLDVDIWFMPMPGHVLSADEREKTSAINLVASDWKHINPKTWTPAHAAFIRTAAEQPEVERVLVNAAIKKEMCRMQGDKHPAWMEKVRPWYAHHDHIHVRLECPAGSPNCRKQPPVPGDDGCGKGLDYWFSDKVLHPKPRPPGGKPPRALTMADLPPACQTVLAAPERAPNN
ncbi:MAG: penicillin-insensitive murein endopeptidase [Pseudolabrys sp.]|nr:penicillin-insensitive murein endopeptidase [Pseudolabrys sp.]